MHQKFYYICNVFDESTKLKRNISTDSPAASRKVAHLCRAVRKVGGDARIISLGRGRATGTMRRYPATAKIINNVPIIYIDHWDIPVLTHLVTIISLCILVLRTTTKGSVLVFYNNQIHYALALILGRLLGRKCIFDIEDGYRSDDKNIRSYPHLILLNLFNLCCNGGAMLASSALMRQTSAEHIYVCYGIAEPFNQKKDWTLGPTQILFGGLLHEDTGAELFIETLKLMQMNSSPTLQKLRFVVTGYGEFSERLQNMARSNMSEFLIFKGKVSASEYREILSESHVGLSLKLPSTSMGATTFPSKVVEFAANGLLVVSTRVSDVPIVFDDTNAILIEEATPDFLADALSYLVDHPDISRKIASDGLNRIASLLSEEKIGNELLLFWQGDSVSPRDQNV